MTSVLGSILVHSSVCSSICPSLFLPIQSTNMTKHPLDLGCGLDSEYREMDLTHSLVSTRQGHRGLTIAVDAQGLRYETGAGITGKGLFCEGMGSQRKLLSRVAISAGSGGGGTGGKPGRAGRQGFEMPAILSPCLLGGSCRYSHMVWSFFCSNSHNLPGSRA